MKSIITLFLFKSLCKYLYNLAYYPRILKLCLDLKLVDRKLVFLHYLQIDRRTDKQTAEIWTIARVTMRSIISLFLFKSLFKSLYNLAFHPRILKLCLDLKLVDGKLVFWHYLHTDGLTDKQTDRYCKRHNEKHNFFFFIQIFLQIPL